MAIVVEQEKGRSDIFVFVGWLGVMITIVVIIYYLFFQKPELIPIPQSSDFSLTSNVAGIEINPSIVINDPAFSNRQPYVSIPGIGQTGRPNPFLSY